RPLGVDAARAALDSGTALLSYSVGEKKTFLFLLTHEPAGGFECLTLPLGESGLRSRVAAFPALIEGDNRGGASQAREPRAGARQLYGGLGRPAQQVVERSRRVLIAPDGPLQELPFAALLESRGPDRYWVESKPLHLILSATLYAELRPGRHIAPEGGRLVAFADPEAPSAARSGSRVGVVAGSRGLGRLPWAREEAQRIAGLFGPDSVQYLGAAATEEKARGLRPGVAYVHFAAHALLDRRFPLDSALVLSPDPQQEP